MSVLADQIQTLFEEDMKNVSQPVYDVADIPLSYESITPEWLTSALCASVPAANVESLELGPRDDGSSNRRRISIHYNEAGNSAGLPEKVFCKASHTLENRIVQRIDYSCAFLGT